MSKLHDVLYLFEQRCHKHRVDALTEQQLTTKLLKEKNEAALALKDKMLTMLAEARTKMAPLTWLESEINKL